MDYLYMFGFVVWCIFLYAYYKWVLQNQGVSLLEPGPILTVVLVWILLIFFQYEGWAGVVMMALVVVICLGLLVRNIIVSQSNLHGVLRTLWHLTAVTLIILAILMIIHEISEAVNGGNKKSTKRNKDRNA